jgi:dTDP-4-dehydrorhamnose reductase
MKVLITGANGQLGHELQRSAPAHVQCLALDRTSLDITDADTVDRVLDIRQPQLIINAAAYTAVDKAEQDEANAARINAEAPGLLARAAAERALRIIHVSTDFVFDGASSQPYRPAGQTRPLSVYGASKREGELRVLREAGEQALVLRTGWVYSAHGNNFVKTMLRLMAERDALNVVSDQLGTPTWAYGLAAVIWQFSEQPQLHGVFHWSDAGTASWYDFAVAIQEEACALGLLRKAVPIHPIRSADYPAAAQRPAYAVLDKAETWTALAVEPVHWRAALRQMLSELK